jgi:anti-sigma B factor antagonist
VVREDSVSGCGCDDDSLLSVRVGPGRSGETVVRLAGELDLYTAGRVAAALAELLGSAHGSVVVDLADLDFVGARGLDVFVQSHTRYAQAGVRLVFRAVPAGLMRILAVTSLDQVLTVE